MRRLLLAAILMLCLAAGAAAQQAAWQPPPPTPGALVTQPAGYKQDAVEFTLAPKEGMEYKYHLEKGAGMLYSGTATGPVHYEMHSVPDGAPSDFAETFDKQDDRHGAHAAYTAPFTGIHGWYWQNRTQEPVTIRLTTAGFYTESQEFRRGQDMRRKPF